MTAKDTWVLVANSTIARLYRLEKNHTLNELELFEHPEGRLREQDLASDKPGRAFESMGTSRSSMEVKTPMKKQECIDFARKIANRLDSEREKGKFARLVLVAGPEFLGLLRKELKAGTLQLVAKELDKDMTQVEEKEIAKHCEYI